MAHQTWLFKTEPHKYSIEDLKKDKKTNWNGVRNFQARNFLRASKVGDRILIYHSGDVRAAVGIAVVQKEHFPDLDPKKPGDWVQVEILFERLLPHPVTLKQIKSERSLKDMLLIKQSRLSVMPVTQKEFDQIVMLGR